MPSGFDELRGAVGQKLVGDSPADLDGVGGIAKTIGKESLVSIRTQHARRQMQPPVIFNLAKCADRRKTSAAKCRQQGPLGDDAIIRFLIIDRCNRLASS